MLPHALSLVLAMVPQDAVPTDSNNGSYLVRSCKAYISFADGNVGKDPQTDAVYAVHCLGYVTGYVDAINEGTTKICFSHATIGTMARVYLTYMQKNPKLFDSDQKEGLKQALFEAYPCSPNQ